MTSIKLLQGEKGVAIKINDVKLVNAGLGNVNENVLINVCIQNYYIIIFKSKTDFY